MAAARERLLALWPFAASLASAALLAIAAPGVVPLAAASTFAWIAFLPICFAILHLRPQRALLAGWIAGLAFHAVAGAWLPGVIARFSGMTPVAAVLASAALWCVQGLGWGAWAALSAMLKDARWVAPATAALFVTLERCVPQPFPYSIGLTQYRNLWIAQSSELGGPWVIAFLIVLTGAALAQGARGLRSGSPRAWVPPAAAIALLIAATLFGAVRERSIRSQRLAAPQLRVGAIQAATVQTRWRAVPDPPDLLQRYQQQSGALEQSHGPLDLLVWPEKAYPHLLRRDSVHDHPPSHPKRIRIGFQAPLIFGHNAVEIASRELTNAASLLAPDDRMFVFYEKVRLIPYSEWLPEPIARRAKGARYSSGASLSPLLLPSGRVGTFICFESSFPSHVRALSKGQPHWLLNLSDDAWFGESAEPEQHLAQVVLRAVESRRDVLRAAGSGISAHVSASGEILQATTVSHGAPTHLLATVKKLEIRSLYLRLGDGFVALCALGAAAALVTAIRRTRRAGGPQRYAAPWRE